MGAQHVDRPRVRIELDDRIREGSAREGEPHVDRRLHPFVPRLLADEHEHLLERERAPRCLDERDMAPVRWIESTPEQPSHGSYSNDSAPSSTVAPRRAPASL